VVVGVVWLVFFSSALAVKDVRVVGVEVLDASEVDAQAAVPFGSPLATVDLELIAQRVQELTAVRDVDVTRAWPDSVRIEVRERVAVAVVERNGQNGPDGTVQGVDETGVVFRSYPSRPASLPLLQSGPDTSAEALAESTLVVDALPAEVAQLVDYVDVQTVDTITLHLRDGRRVLWGSANQSPSKAEVLSVLLEQKASAYDVSVPGQPVIRP